MDRSRLGSLLGWIAAQWGFREPDPILFDVNGAGDRTANRRALMLHVSKAFIRSEDDPRFFRHQNRRRARMIAGLLGERGYVVDVSSSSNARFASPWTYDLVLCDRVDSPAQYRLRPGGRRIFLATTIHHRVHNQNLRQRHQRLAARRTGQVKLRRIYTEEFPYLAQADTIFCVGNQRSADTWRADFAGPVLTFDNAGYREQRPATDRDYLQAGRHFLFFASRSQVQKGLDLLLEVIPRHPDFHLHVCSEFSREPDFCACYRRELFHTPNIHLVGWIQIGGNEFQRLIRQCAYAILPTCSEGQAGSVVQCMHAGLIPVVTREAGLDTGDFGVTLADDSLGEIERTICDLAARSPEWIEDMSQRTVRAAQKTFSEEAQTARWREMLAAVLDGGIKSRAA